MILRTGRIDDNVLDRSVRKRLGTVYARDANVSQDAGMAEFYSYSETLHTGHAGMLSVIGAVNGLAARGFMPEKLRTDILLPVGTDEQVLRDIEDEIRSTAESAGVRIAGGHTAVTAAVTRPFVTAETIGKRLLRERDRAAGESDASDISGNSGETGADIFLIGHIGLSGTFLLAEERRDELEARFPVQMARRAAAMRDELLMTSVAEKLMAAVREAAVRDDHDQGGNGAGGQGNKVPLMLRVSDGGIYAGLWKLAEQLNCGFEVDLPRIPVYQETIEICNYYGINPYQMSSEGCFLAVAGNDVDPDLLLNHLAEEDVYIRPIGHLEEGRDKVIINGEERQSLNRPAADALIPLLG